MSSAHSPKSNGGKQPRLVALTNRDFRLIWVGQLVSNVGSEMQLIAINWHVFTLLKDQSLIFSIFGHQVTLGAEALGLGGVGLVRIIPIAIFALAGGMLADARDRRTMIIWTQSVAAVFAVALAAITLAGRESLFAIYFLTALTSATQAFENPAKQSLIPNLVPRHHLTNALSLNTLVWHISTIIGPAIAGVMVANFDIGLVYLVNAVSFFALILAAVLMRYRGGAATVEGLGWDSFIEGLRFTFDTRLIRSTMLLDFFATLFSSARTMLPLVADNILHVGAQGYGILSTAQSVGALLAGVSLSLRQEIKQQGRVLLISVAIYGLATALFGISTIFALSYFLFALTGAGDTVSTVIRNTLRQMITPDRLRGRMSWVNMIFFMGGPQLGELEAGLVAAAFGAPFAIFTGGVATVLLTGWIAWEYPRLRKYQAGDYVNMDTTESLK
ncbi:MAG: MFS transporter [Candidatus Promineifilaceae bacterium]